MTSAYSPYAVAGGMSTGDRVMDEAGSTLLLRLGDQERAGKRKGEQDDAADH